MNTPLPSLLALLLATTVIFNGCDDDSSSASPSDMAAPDAAIPPPDAAQPDSDSPDAATPDAEAPMADAGPPDAEPLPDAEPGPPPDGRSLVPAPGDEDHDEAMATKAFNFDRGFHALHAPPTGLNAELQIRVDREAEWALVDRFFNEHEGWDFEAFAEMPLTDLVDGWDKVAGAYAGVGVAADAFRYGVLRDEGGAPEEVERARALLIRGLDGLHSVVGVTGVPGVIARGIARADLQGAGMSVQPVPLFDDDGQPQPEPKNNGTWRVDNSGGDFPDLVWEDSCSRDMLVGWAMGMSAAWEVIDDDEDFPQAAKDRLQADARAVALSLATVQESGFDLEIRDADGRRTFHGTLNESAVEQNYLRNPINGFYALMGLGIATGLAFVAEDPEVEAWLRDELIATRGIHLVARDRMLNIHGVGANYSGYAMAMNAAWMAYRYVRDPAVERAVSVALIEGLYAHEDDDHQPAFAGQAFYDLIVAAITGRATVERPLQRQPDPDLLSRAQATLSQFPAPPYRDLAVINCDEQEIEAGRCIAIDGSEIEVLGFVGRNDGLHATEALPMSIRPPSNYHWRSSPFQPNGGGSGQRLLPAVDFRVAYWLGRFVR